MNSIILINREFHFGIGFINEFLENSGVLLNEIDKELQERPFFILPQMIYYSHLYACKRYKKPIDFDLYDVNDWIDENGGLMGEFVQSFQLAFLNSLSKDVPIDENKKKVRTKKSTSKKM